MDNSILTTWSSYLRNYRPFRRLSRLALRYAKPGPVRTKYGFWINYREDDDAALRKMVISGEYETGFLRLLKTLANGTILDIGAHEGFVSLYLSGPTRHVIACEPNPDLLEILHRNITLNSAPITVVPMAVGDHDGEVTFHCSGSAGSIIE